MDASHRLRIVTNVLAVNTKPSDKTTALRFLAPITKQKLTNTNIFPLMSAKFKAKSEEKKCITLNTDRQLIYYT